MSIQCCNLGQLLYESTQLMKNSTHVVYSSEFIRMDSLLQCIVFGISDTERTLVKDFAGSWEEPYNEP